MGLKLATCNNCGCGHCEQCICARADRCAALCHRPPQRGAVVQTLAAVQDESPIPKPERYALLGADCAPRHYVCSDLGPPLLAGEAYLDEGIAAIPDPSDQVLVSDGPGGSELRNISELRRIGTLEDECRFNASKVRKIRGLAQAYGHWRSVRGDGNCFYRAVAFGALEGLLAAGDRARWRQILNVLEQVHYASEPEQRSHERLLRHLRTWSSAAQLEEWVSQDGGVDKALVRACRRLVRLFLLKHADELAPNGLTYSQLVDPTYRDVKDFCGRVVDPMGCDAETPAVEALPIQLGVGLRLWILDRREEAELVSLDTPGPDGQIDVHVLFKPGHYDLLYARESPAKVTAAEPLAAKGAETASTAQQHHNASAQNMASLPLPRRPVEVHLSARHAASMPSPVPLFQHELGLRDGAPLATRAFGLPQPPRHTPPPGAPTVVAPHLPVPAGLDGLLPIEISPAFTPTSKAGLTPTFAFTPTLAPSFPRTPAPAPPSGQVPALPTALCSTPLVKMREGEKAPLRCIPVCGVLACPQATSAGPLPGSLQPPGGHQPNAGSAGPSPAGKGDGMATGGWGGVLGCGYGIIFSLSGFVQGAAAPRRHFP